MAICYMRRSSIRKAGHNKSFGAIPQFAEVGTGGSPVRELRIFLGIARQRPIQRIMTMMPTSGDPDRSVPHRGGHVTIIIMTLWISSVTHSQLVEIEKTIRTATKKHNDFLSQLGLAPLPFEELDKD